MSYSLQQIDIDVLRQHTKQLFIKFDILNQNMQTINSIQKYVASGDYSIDASSDIRKTLNFTISLKNKSEFAEIKRNVWIDKILKVSIGIKSIRTGDILWYQIGLYLFNDNAFTYNSTTNELTVKCVDFMAKLNGIRGGSLYGAETITIPAGSNIRSSMISALNQFGNITKYLIDDVGAMSKVDVVTQADYNVVPYDLTFNVGDTANTVITKLRDLYPGYEIFFDGDTFVCQKIPTTESDTNVLDYETIEKNQLVISEERNNSLDVIKNVIEVWGKQITADRYTDICTNTGAQYKATFTDLTALSSGIIYAIKLNISNASNATININNLGAYPIVDSDGIALSANTINGYSAFKFLDNKFYYLGQYQVHAIAMLVSSEPSDQQKSLYSSKYNCDNIVYVVNPDCPYTIENIGKDTTDPYTYGVILEVKKDNDFANIYSNQLAIERAKYELWKSTRLQDTITLEMQSIFWIDVNQKFSYRSKTTGDIEEWIIKSVSMKLLDGTMSITASKFYPLYPEIL